MSVTNAGYFFFGPTHREWFSIYVWDWAQTIYNTIFSAFIFSLLCATEHTTKNTRIPILNGIIVYQQASRPVFVITVVVVAVVSPYSVSSSLFNKLSQPPQAFYVRLSCSNRTISVHHCTRSLMRNSRSWWCLLNNIVPCRINASGKRWCDCGLQKSGGSYGEEGRAYTHSDTHILLTRTKGNLFMNWVCKFHGRY